MDYQGIPVDAPRDDGEWFGKVERLGDLPFGIEWL